MRTFQRVQIMGYVGGEAEQRITGNGHPVTTFTVATTFRWKSEGQEEYQERTDWHRIVAWGSLASWALQTMRRGEPVLVEGRLVYSTWKDKDGNERSGVEIRATEINPLRSKADQEARAAARRATVPA